MRDIPSAGRQSWHYSARLYFAAANTHTHTHALQCGHFVNMDQDHTQARIPHLTERESPPECKDCPSWVGGGLGEEGARFRAVTMTERREGGGALCLFSGLA